MREVIKRIGPCTLHAAAPADPFEALCRSIASQQLSIKAAETIFRRFCERFAVTQHLASPPLVELEGDRARARTRLRALHVQEDPTGARNTWTVYGVYHDVLARGPEGWRIVERHFRSVHMEGSLWPEERSRR